MVSKRTEGVRGSRAKNEQKKCGRVPFRLMEERSGRVKSVESIVWTRWRCRRCYHDIPASLRGKHRQAVAARNGERSTGSSTSIERRARQEDQK